MKPALALTLQQLAGPNVAVSVQLTRDRQGELYDSEKVAMARASAVRLAEFTAGRVAVRAAMQWLGHPETAVPMGPDRAPVWPPGLIGSISHCDGVCAALVARANGFVGIGIDLETDDPLPTDLWDVVCTKAEIDSLHTLPFEKRGAVAKLIFSAKECTYKCIYPQTRTVMEFDALDIALHPAGQNFTATLATPIGPFASGTVWTGNLALIDGLIATVMVLR